MFAYISAGNYGSTKKHASSLALSRHIQPTNFYDRLIMSPYSNMHQDNGQQHPSNYYSTDNYQHTNDGHIWHDTACRIILSWSGHPAVRPILIKHHDTISQQPDKIMHRTWVLSDTYNKSSNSIHKSTTILQCLRCVSISCDPIIHKHR